MCAQYSINAPLEKLKDYYGAIYTGDKEFLPSPHVFPKQPLPIITAEDGKRALEIVHWGLKPAWMEKLGKSKELINVRADSLLEKPSMKKFLMHRCLVPATGFYEWKTEPNGKKSLYTFEKKGTTLFSMAGVVQINNSDEIEKFAIVTTEPNEYVKPIHNRMPFILTREEEELWLNTDETKVRELLNAQILTELNNIAVSKV